MAPPYATTRYSPGFINTETNPQGTGYSDASGQLDALMRMKMQQLKKQMAPPKVSPRAASRPIVIRAPREDPSRRDPHEGMEYQQPTWVKMMGGGGSIPGYIQVAAGSPGAVASSAGGWVPKGMARPVLGIPNNAVISSAGAQEDALRGAAADDDFARFSQESGASPRLGSPMNHTVRGPGGVLVPRPTGYKK